MPEIKLLRVMACSSEDTTHTANNLLSSDTYRKWKAARPGEKQTSVILQFEKQELVHSLDIGNEGSAFIEVLVGNSAAAKDQEYEVLLATSAFMSPMESRNGTNTNRVRIFGNRRLNKITAQKKWDTVMIVCSQPYNKTIAYGVSFVKFFSPPGKNDPPEAASPNLTKLGQFKMKDESSSVGPCLQPGSLFLSRDIATKSSPALKASPQKEKLSYAAAALQSGQGSHSSSQVTSTVNSTSTSASPQQPVKKTFEFSKDRHSAPPALNKISLAASPESIATTSKLKAKSITKPSPVSTPTPTPSTNKASPAQKTPDKKVRSQSKPKLLTAESQSAEPVLFNRIMEGVVFVLSGFQNPFRAELRDQALAMGAKYRSDWSSDSTHLICAFANTPKYSLVKSAGGIIVRKEWVLDCYKKKQRISFKQYLMEGEDRSSDSEMETENQIEGERVMKSPQKPDSSVMHQKTPEKIKKEDESGSFTDVEEPGDDESPTNTDDELKRVKCDSKQAKAQMAVKAEKEEDLYGGSTDENTDTEAEVDYPIPELPNFLTGKTFFLYGKFPNKERRLLYRYIVAFNGAVEDYMSEKVQFVVTSEGWHHSFEDALMENGNLCFVKPTWIYAINDRKKMLPYQPYSVVL